jgi:hypothetical protein
MRILGHQTRNAARRAGLHSFVTGTVTQDPQRGDVTEPAPDRTRVSLLLIASLWASALAILFIGFRLRLKPVLLIGALDLVLALGATTLVLSRKR